jgi:Calcineurin-like phosphoesterase
MSSPYRLLHIADPHFSECHFLDGAPFDIGRRHAQELEEVLIQHERLRTAFDAIILSGDFSFVCRKSGFEAAAIFVERISRFVRPGGLLVLPGNHDIDLSKQVALGGLSLPTSKAEAEGPFREFLAAIAKYVGAPNHYLSRIIRIQGHGKPGLVLAGLNSCRVERYDARGWGYIGADQIYDLYSRLYNGSHETQTQKGDLVLAVTHHNLLPIWDVDLRVLFRPPEKRKFSFVMDAGGTLNFLSDLGISALLHGHTHVPSEKRVYGYGSGDRTEYRNLILGTGSLGIAKQRIALPHHFRIIEIDDGSLLQYEDFTADLCPPNTLRTWRKSKMTRPLPLMAWWEADRVRKELEMHNAAAHTARFDSENLESWSLLRVKALQPNLWPGVFSGLCQRVRKIRPRATDEAISLAVESILERSPSDDQLRNFTLEQIVVVRMMESE